MQTKNLVAYDYRNAVLPNITKKFKSTKKSNWIKTFVILIFLSISIFFLLDFYKVLTSTNNRISFVTDFKLDINTLSETALILQAKRDSKPNSEINNYGSDGKTIDANVISSDLSSAIINIADTNNDGSLSFEEISNLKLMKLDVDTYKKEMNVLQLNLKSADCNLKNYLVITQGKYAGTILYNGPLKFIDDNNKRYFGLDLKL
ncbi:hypothetical protein [Clostridium saccharoperbutylacetonicum]|uniref:hypothetical protein n=1 Tax=Clostridium saccharoperbutylacetonicum TaxID=36745 RepID=UPI0039EB09E2